MVKKVNKSNTEKNIAKEILGNIELQPTKELEALKELIFNSPDINQARIDFIKEEIAAGRYQIEPQNIAASILEESQAIVEEVELA